MNPNESTVTVAEMEARVAAVESHAARLQEKHADNLRTLEGLVERATESLYAADDEIGGRVKQIRAMNGAARATLDALRFLDPGEAVLATLDAADAYFDAADEAIDELLGPPEEEEGEDDEFFGDAE